MNRSASIRRPILAVPALLLLAGCFVTSSQLNKKLNDFDEYLKKREGRTKIETDLKREEIGKKLDEASRALANLEARLSAIRAELKDMREKMSVSLDSAQRMQDLQTDVRRALTEIRTIEDRLDRRVGDTVDKYKEVLLEEKRVLTERLRALNESLRALSEKEEGKEK